MTTTCPTSTTMYSWWSTDDKWITNNKRTKIRPNQHSDQFRKQSTNQLSQRRSAMKSTILFTTILVLSLFKPILSDNQLRAPVIIEQPVDVTVRRNDPATLNCKFIFFFAIVFLYFFKFIF